MKPCIAAAALTAAAGLFGQTAPAPPPAQPPAAVPTGTTGSVPVAPPNWSDRRRVFFKKLLGPQAVFETVPAAVFDTARNFPDEWGRTMGGAGRRVGSQYAQFAIGEAIELGVSAVHSEDPRYFRMPDAPFKRRFAHALKSAVVVRKADGTGNTPALGRIANVYGAWAIATTWSPRDQRNVRSVLIWGSFGLSMKAASNVFREFWPDIKKKLKR
jgi:hypothetical protein